MADSKYLPNEAIALIDEIMRRNGVLEKRIWDLEREVRNQDTPQALQRINPAGYPNPFEGQRAIDVTDEQHTWYSDGMWRKAGGLAVYEIKVFEDSIPVVVGDGRFIWEIPEDLNNCEIVKVEGFVSTPSSSGDIQVQLRHLTGGTPPGSDILSSKVTIDANERNSKDSATQPVISGGSILAAWGDHFAIDIDAAGSGAKGLGIIVAAIPSPIGAVTITGAAGPAGGITAWEGQWLTSTSYQIGDAVNNNGTTYVAIADHTSGASTEPGVGASWETAWMVLVQAHQFSALDYVIDGGGYVLDVGVQGPGLNIRYNCTIVEATLLADFVGNIIVDIWKDTYGSYPPLDADSITGSNPLTLSGANKTTDTALTGWNTSLLSGDVLRFNIDSVAAIRAVTVGFKLERI